MLAARPQKITFGDLREMGVRGVLVYCADHHCSHSVTLSADRWPDNMRLSDIEPRFVCAACGRPGGKSPPPVTLESGLSLDCIRPRGMTLLLVRGAWAKVQTTTSPACNMADDVGG
jgi:hypothetical protein